MKRQLISFSLLILLLSSTIVSSAASPTIADISPVDGATNVALTSGKVNLRANVTDADGDLAYISFETNKSGTWAKIADISLSGENWTTDMPIAFSSLATGSQYWWRIKAQDADSHWTNSSAFSFTTQTSGGGGTPVNGTITIVPSQPKSNRNLIFIVTQAETSGYVICQESSNVYPFQITNKMGVVELGTEYGLAEVYIVDYGTKTFSIASPYAEDDMTLEIPSTAKLNDNVQVSVTANGEPISASVKFISPTNKETTKRTTTTSPLEVSFNEAGDWQVIAQVFGTIVNDEISIEAEPISVDVPSSNTVGQEITINTEPDASIIISKDSTQWDIQADEEGNAYFTPETLGRYKIVATSSNGKGTEYFNVQTETAIIAKDDKGFPVSSVAKGDVVFLQVTDTKGQQISANELTVYGDGALIASLPLYGGSAMWRVVSTATTYTIDFSSNDALYLPASLSLTGSGGTNNLEVYYPYIAVAAIIILVIVIVAWRKGYLDNFSGLFSKKEDELL